MWEGRRYSIAREVNTLALYYNADLFRAKGLDPDKPPKTWSEVRAAAEKLTDPEKRVFGIGFCAHASEQSTFQFLPWLWQAGGSINKLDAPEAIEALQYWTDLVQKGYASKDVINQQQNDVMNSFMAGNYAMAVGGPWELPRIQKDAKFDWRVTTLPVKDGKNIQASSLGGFHFAIPKGAKEVDGAFRAIEFLSTPAIFQDGWKSGLMAPRSDVEIKDPLWPKAYAVFREQLKYAIQRGPHPQWPELSRPIQVAIPGGAHWRQATVAGDEGSGTEGPADPGQAAVVTTKPSGARATGRTAPHLYRLYGRDGAYTISAAARLPARAGVLSAGVDRISHSLQHRDQFPGRHAPQPGTVSASLRRPGVISAKLSPIPRSAKYL